MRAAGRALLLVAVALPTIANAAPRKPRAPKPPPPAPAPEPEPVPAEPPPPSSSSAGKPWAVGVSEATQAQASALYEEGNALFAQQAHAPALEKYRAAVALWDHPLIQFNLAVTLIRLDRVLEAAEALDKALRYGEAPFKPELFQQAGDYQKLLTGRVGYVEAACDATVANVLLDGKQWFGCPGTQKLRVLAGEHTLVGEHDGFITSSQRVVVVGGQTASAKLKLLPLESSVVLRYPHRRWIPWTITGIGAAIALGGAGVWFAGSSQMTAFDDNFARECTTTGCEPDLSLHPALRDQRDSAQLKGTIGVTMIVAGGATTVGGIVMAILNRPERVLPNVEIAPAGDGVRASVGWKF